MASKSQRRLAKTRARASRARARQRQKQNVDVNAVIFDIVKDHAIYPWQELAATTKNLNALARARDSTGHIPLHYACSRRAPLALVQTLVERYPHGLLVKNDYRALPLHYCCDRGSDFGVLRSLATAYPQALDQKAFFGNLPIHLLVANEDASLDAIQFVVELYPQGLQVPNDDGMLPLQHCWTRQGVDGRLGVFAERMLYLTKQYPQALFHKWQCGTSVKESMLHNELSFRSRNGGSLDGLVFLLQQLYYPTTTDPAMHVAHIQPEPCRFVMGSRFHGGRHSQEYLLEFLLEHIPETARIAAERIQQLNYQKAGNMEYTNLTEYALKNGTSVAIMECLTAKCPEVLTVRDHRGRNALSLSMWLNSHFTLKDSSKSRVVQKAVFDVLLRRCDANVTSVPDQQGRIALHWALGWSAPVSIITSLLKLYPEGIYIADQYGYYPIHFAALRCQYVEGIYLVLKADPSQLMRCRFPKRTTTGGKEPKLSGDYDLSLKMD